jgi:hypothetical protein
LSKISQEIRRLQVLESPETGGRGLFQQAEQRRRQKTIGWFFSVIPRITTPTVNDDEQALPSRGLTAEPGKRGFETRS